MKAFAGLALAAGVLMAGGANASVVFFEGFDGYTLPSTNGGGTAGVSSTSGNSFTSQYDFRTGSANTGPNSMYDEGTWTITTDPYLVHNLWLDTTGDGNFLVLNGATTSGTQGNPPNEIAYESNGISVGSGAYNFSYDLLNVCCNANGPQDTNPSVLELWYTDPSGAQTIIPVQLNQALVNGAWLTVSGSFVVQKPGGTIHLALTDNGTIASGNDFAVDNITLSTAPEPATWAMMIMGFGGLGAVLRRRRNVAATA